MILGLGLGFMRRRNNDCSYTHTFFIYIYCMQLFLYVWLRLLPAATRHKSSWHSANCHFIANSCGQQGYQRHRWSCQLAIAVRDWLLVVTLALNTNYDRPWRPWTASILRPFGSIGGCYGAVNHTTNDCIVVQLEFENC